MPVGLILSNSDHAGLAEEGTLPTQLEMYHLLHKAKCCPDPTKTFLGG